MKFRDHKITSLRRWRSKFRLDHNPFKRNLIVLYLTFKYCTGMLFLLHNHNYTMYKVKTQVMHIRDFVIDDDIICVIYLNSLIFICLNYHYQHLGSLIESLPLFHTYCLLISHSRFSFPLGAPLLFWSSLPIVWNIYTKGMPRIAYFGMCIDKQKFQSTLFYLPW